MPASETLKTVDTVTFFSISNPRKALIGKENHVNKDRYAA